jgi:hypothetical protein
MVFDAAFALDRIVVEQRLCLFDSGQCQVMRLNSIALVLRYPEVKTGRVKGANYHHG